jgi:hypothetical protein
MTDGSWSTTKVMAWATWALSGLFAVLCVVIDGIHSGTTTLGMALCKVAIILAAAAATLHTRSFFCAFAKQVRSAYDMGVDRGRLLAREEADAVPLQRIR